jgi:hypothetical protein
MVVSHHVWTRMDDDFPLCTLLTSGPRYQDVCFGGPMDRSHLLMAINRTMEGDGTQVILSSAITERQRYFGVTNGPSFLQLMEMWARETWLQQRLRTVAGILSHSTMKVLYHNLMQPPRSNVWLALGLVGSVHSGLLRTTLLMHLNQLVWLVIYLLLLPWSHFIARLTNLMTFCFMTEPGDVISGEDTTEHMGVS